MPDPSALQSPSRLDYSRASACRARGFARDVYSSVRTRTAVSLPFFSCGSPTLPQNGHSHNPSLLSSDSLMSKVLKQSRQSTESTVPPFIRALENYFFWTLVIDAPG